MADPEVFRRPGAKWCTDTAIRLLRISAREDGGDVEDGEYRPFLDKGERVLLLRAAAVLDSYGQRLSRPGRRAGKP